MIERFIYYKNPTTVQKETCLKFNPYLSESLHPTKCGYHKTIIIYVIEQETLIISDLSRKIINKAPLKNITKIIYSQDSKDLIKRATRFHKKNGNFPGSTGTIERRNTANSPMKLNQAKSLVSSKTNITTPGIRKSCAPMNNPNANCYGFNHSISGGGGGDGRGDLKGDITSTYFEFALVLKKKQRINLIVKGLDAFKSIINC